MKIKILCLSIAMLLAGCEDSSSVITSDMQPIMPPGLSDCGVYKIYYNSKSHTVFRCPNSSTTTTYKVGKSTMTTVVIDGKTYQEVENNVKTNKQ